MRGGAGLGGVDGTFLRNLLINYSDHSRRLRQVVATFCSWMANSSPPWAAYRAFREGRLIAPDKQPGIRPIGIGEIWSRLFAKVVLVDA